VVASDAMDALHGAARMVAAACSKGEALRADLAVLQRLAGDPADTIGLRRRVAARLIQYGQYLP
jgi:hypothetical protein